ncbi:hypothetical protein RHSP_43945 [Rhizobium freirei PRF 81]|uniref:Uncharacterized protein n=1 Tax=Rhizobium freirei PRF 81 TaxID=363754 RepID=N6V933_9HYPH|nr:hypothetical protein RHSP_43945 [Rhizobium freirei PRF 81]
MRRCDKLKVPTYHLKQKGRRIPATPLSSHSPKREPISPSSRSELQFLADHGTQRAEILGEGADAFGELLGCHRVFVHHPAEGLLVDRDLFDRTLVLRRELALQLAFVLGKIVEQVRADRQSVATGQRFDFAGVAERGAHDDRLDVVGLVVVVDVAHRDDARIFLSRVILAGRLLVPVEDAADEGRDQECLGVSAGNSLRLAEQQRQIAVDAFLLQHFGGTDAFPGGGELDEDAITLDAALLVGSDDGAGLGERGLRIERQVGVDFGRNTTGNETGKRCADGDCQTVGNGSRNRFGGTALPLAPSDGFLDRIGEHRRAERLQHDGRVGGAIHRLEARDGLDIAGIGHHGGHGAELVKLGSHNRYPC